VSTAHTHHNHTTTLTAGETAGGLSKKSPREGDSAQNSITALHTALRLCMQETTELEREHLTQEKVEMHKITMVAKQ
jgi:hypothetical protein